MNHFAGGVGENGVLRAPSPPRVVIPTLTPAQLQSAGQKGIDALRVKISYTKIKCHVCLKYNLICSGATGVGGASFRDGHQGHAE
jgi:hypothetical protein